MPINAGLRLVAGFFVLLSVTLGYYVNPLWFLFTGFVELNAVRRVGLVSHVLDIGQIGLQA